MSSSLSAQGNSNVVKFNKTVLLKQFYGGFFICLFFNLFNVSEIEKMMDNNKAENESHRGFPVKKNNLLFNKCTTET